MKSKIPKKYKLAKDIRKFLLITVDKEMKNKKKKKHLVLINSMNPTELENLFQMNQESINTTITTFTNIAENRLFERVLDNKNNINYFYSEHLGSEKGKVILKKNPYNFLFKFSKKKTTMDIGLLFNNELEKKEEEENNYYVHLYSIALIKENIGEIKFGSDKSLINSNLGLERHNSELTKAFTHQYSQNDFNSNLIDYGGKKILNNKNINSILIDYCYKNLKKKLPKKYDKRSSNPSLFARKKHKEEVDNKITRRKTYNKLKKKKLKKKEEIIPNNKDINNNIKINRYKSIKINKTFKGMNLFVDKNKKINIEKVNSINKMNSKIFKIKSEKDIKEMYKTDNNNNKRQKMTSLDKLNSKKSMGDYTSTNFSSNKNLKIIKSKSKVKVNNNFLKDSYNNNINKTKLYSNKDIYKRFSSFSKNKLNLFVNKI